MFLRERRERFVEKSNAAEVIVHNLLLNMLSVRRTATFSCCQRIQTNTSALGSAEDEEESCSGRGNISEWAVKEVQPPRSRRPEGHKITASFVCDFIIPAAFGRVQMDWEGSRSQWTAETETVHRKPADHCQLWSLCDQLRPPWGVVLDKSACRAANHRPWLRFFKAP